ncbi:unnamed protein product [Hermetia illucens]|uniref:Cell division control protein n=1 Tax=Hermetia illucens TaxID=343691 RepID=A0A7R8UUN9_HERIL|nr:cell division control protein 6 homolog [Hermetia illucens]CAD7087327.1 unnamed protein product [Hermetia illucens]
MPLITRRAASSRHKTSTKDVLSEINGEIDDASTRNVNGTSKSINDEVINTENGLKTPKRNNKRASKLACNGHTDESDTETSSPPKQPKSDPALFSPSSLIRNLRIDDQPDKEERSKSPRKSSLSRYGNARKVLNGAETDDLPGREAEIQELRSFFLSHLESGTSGSLYVSGQPGTGKTACLTHILRSEEISSNFTKVYINCTGVSTVGSIYKKICTELRLKLDGKTEKDSLRAIEKYLSGKHKMLLMILDEVDQLAGRKQSILYTIFEWPAKPNSKLVLVSIANQLDLTDRTLTRLNAKCDLKPKLMHFSPYSREQLITIFKSRLEAAGVLNVFSPGTLQLLSAKVAAVSGDVRRALDIGRRVVELAEQQQKKPKSKVDLTELGIDGSPPKKQNQTTQGAVPMQLVVSVLNNVYGASQTLSNDIEDTFPLQQKILICCLLLILENDKNKDITIGRLHDVFKRVCSKRNLMAVDQAEFVGLCSLVETRGIVRVIGKKEPRLSKIVLQWDQGEVTAALKDKQLIAAILQDTLCLKR